MCYLPVLTNCFLLHHRHAIVEELASLGATVHMCSRNKDELERSLRDWEEQGLEVSGSVCNVSSEADRERLLDDVSSIFNGKLDILVSSLHLDDIVSFLFKKIISEHRMGE